jgi:hemin uptake protein HemP
MMPDADETTGAIAAVRTPLSASVRSVTSEALMRGQRLLVIQHGNEAYRLQITQGGKLILTK